MYWIKTSPHQTVKKKKKKKGRKRQQCLFFEEECVCSFIQSCPTLCDSLDRSLPGSLSMGLSRQEYCSGLPFPTAGDLPNPGMEPTSLMSPALAGRFFTTSATWEAQASCKSIHIHRFWVGNKMHIG